MRTNHFKTILKAAVRVLGVLPFAAVVAFGQQQINLTAGPSTLTQPDGSKIPMWGYTCGSVVGASTATCKALNSGAGWSPVVITVPTGQTLQINLTNNLSFSTGSGTNTVPTSLVIVGQLGGGLGMVSQRTTTSSPTHATENTTWPIANTGVTYTPQSQADRVRSFSTEVAAGAMKSLTWTTPRPGTYLIESGTHPSIQGPMGLYGMLVVTCAPGATGCVGATPGTAYTGVSYNAEVPLLLSEIDPVQNASVQTAVTTAGFNETMVWSGQAGGCGNPASANYNQCYPPAVNYIPLYYLINGVSFNKTSASASLFPTSPATGLTAGTGKVLVRFVNAGLRMHVPSIVASQTASPAVPGFSLIAEDGNLLPGIPRVQSEVFMAAGKTYDVMVNVPAAGSAALAAFDRELSLSGNYSERDAGMLAYISVNGARLPSAPALTPAVATADLYNSVVPGQTLTVSDASRGVIANDINVYGVKVSTLPAHGTLTLNANGTFTYIPDATWSSSTVTDTFVYQATNYNGPTATVTLNKASLESSGGITVSPITFTSNLATYLKIAPPGVLSVDSDAAGHPLSVALTSVAGGVVAGSGSATYVTAPLTGASGGTVILDSNGGLTASVPGAGSYSFSYKAQNSQGTVSSSAASVTLTFLPASGITVSVVDGKTNAPLSPQDYRWLIEEDRSFYNDPTKTTNAGASGSIVPILGVNFHTSDMPYVAQGCTGTLSCEGGQTIFDPGSGNHIPAVCDVGNGVCRPDTTGHGMTPALPGQVVACTTAVTTNCLDPNKRYYISVLPGDAANPFTNANTTAACYNGGSGPTCGHSMGGAPIAVGQKSVTVAVEQDPFPPGKLSVLVFEDDDPLNGEQDAGGGVDVLAPNEPGLGGFNIVLWDDMGGSGDVTGQMNYDMFNMPLANSLAGTQDPTTGFDACPISTQATNDSAQAGLTGMIVTCPKYESDGQTLSPLAGQAIIANLMPGRFSVQAIPGADRIGRGEQWLQTNTLDGQKAHDSFIRIGEPSYFQEYGPAGYHVTIGFANPAIINSRLKLVCAGNPGPTGDLPPGSNCNNTVTGKVTTERMSRTPDERLYSSGSRDSFYWTQCYVSVGDPDGADFAFTKCNADGTFTLTGLPSGDWRLTTFDQWNDQLVDGLSFPVSLGPSNVTTNMNDVPANQWQANVYTRTFIDDNKDGVSQSTEAGIPLIPVSVRYRDGSLSNNLLTDFNGTANFNEEFPLFNWYVVESDVTRYKNTGTHVVYDAGGPPDSPGKTGCGGGFPPCGSSTIGKYLANTIEQVSVPANLRVPGSVYCANADCVGYSIQSGPSSSASPTAGTTYLSTGRIDNPWFGGVEGWQGYSGQNNFIEFGKELYAAGENGGIQGHVIYASTRPFDDPMMLVQTQWEPLVPHVTINLYQEGTAPDGTQTLTLVDTTQTSSWDDFAQGFRSDGVPNMNCPGQSTSDLFYFSLYNQPNYLNLYSSLHGGPAVTALPNNSQFKCYDGMHNWNQLQPAPYDGMYAFPSITSTSPATGKPLTSNCTICSANNVVPTTDLYYGTPMLPAGKYVVEVVPPTGYELVKEEDKNILIGDNFIAPAVQEFPGLAGDIFIIPDQASVAAANLPGPGYNANNAQNPTQNLGTTPIGDTVPGFPIEPVWPCVGQPRIVPDFISLYPQSKEVAPFAGATRPLCDRKEVTLTEQSAVTAKFYIYTSTHKAAKYTGVITDDFTSEFDPFSPQFGEKFAPPNMPISVKDWTGAETSRVYSDWWGDYDGLTYSTWEVNPPNPTGYSPTMMVLCMNDSGSGSSPDPLFNPAYSQFCYELPFMPGQTDYLDTPVVPTSAFSEGYNHPDCAYPAATPAVSRVDGDGSGGGPWVSANGKTLTITALGDQLVNNYGYSGPQATTAPFNQKTITRHYGFGAATGTVALVGSDGVSHLLTGVSWGDTQITGVVPSGVPNCAVQQQAQYGGSGEKCGELVITTAAGKQSVDAVTVTIGGKAPTYVTCCAPMSITGPGAIQSAIDAAAPGDLIIVPPGRYEEMLLLWKPVRLQGVGAASSIIDANTQPAGKLDPWRRQVDCLFGLALTGTAYSSGTNPTVSPTNPSPYDSTGTYSCPGQGWKYFSGAPNSPQVDRLPLEGMVGWDATVNGNLAQLLQEPTLMGAYEGAGITILAKGVNVPTGGSGSYYGNGSEAVFPTGTTLLSSSTSGSGAAGNGGGDCGKGTTGSGYFANPYPSSFQCNPARIDGLAITDSSQGGGGIFLHAWGHNLEIANDRVYNNIGTLSGGINIGQGEFPDAYISVGSVDTVDSPASCYSASVSGGVPDNTQLPYCFNLNVNVHHNQVTLNSSIGDELFSATPAGAGGVTFCSGADYYKFNYNWVCGNMGTGDGGGVAHLGFIWNGDIEHNSILFNQSTNPTIPTNGAGIAVLGAAPDGAPAGAAAGTECGSTNDVDCPPGLSDGSGPGLVINANLINGNAAESGSGGGIRLQSVNGTEVSRFPNSSQNWYSVKVSNNIITNNVAGWDGAGISLQDALLVNFIDNTVVSNDSTASAGPLFNTLGAPLGSAPGPGIAGQTANGTTSLPQAAGLVTMSNSTPLTASFATNTPPTITCPSNHLHCAGFSNPVIANDLFWQNRSFYIGVGSLSTQYQQNVVSLYNLSGSAAANQPSADATQGDGAGLIVTGGTGACTPGAGYWDIGVRGDTGPGNHNSNLTLAPQYSVLTNTGATSENGAGSGNFLGTDPQVVSQYCNGSRTPPEFASGGYNVPPGISDATVPNPIFHLTPTATVDEGNNWVNIQWGPLSLVNPVSGTTLGNYALSATSPAIDAIASTASTYSLAPHTDFFGNPRPDPAKALFIDVGAVEFQGTRSVSASVTPTALNFNTVAVGSTSPYQTVTLNNPTGATLTAISFGTTAPFVVGTGSNAGTCGPTLANGSTCTIKVAFSPTAAVTSTGSLTLTASAAVLGAPVALTGTGAVSSGGLTVTPTSLTFPGSTTISDTSSPLALTLSNTSSIGVTGIGLSFSPQFSRSTTSAGTCGTTLAGGSVATPATCTINVVFSPTALGTVNGSVAISASVTVANSPVALSGTGAVPVLTVLDSFNRATAAHLNASNAQNNPWTQLGATGTAALQLLDTTSGNTSTGVAYCNGTSCILGGTAYWNNGLPTTGFGSKQAAAFQFENTSGTVNASAPGYSLMLKATGLSTFLETETDHVRVTYIPSASTVAVAYSTTAGLTYTTASTFAASFAGGAPGDLMGAMVDTTGKVWVWKTSGATTTLLGTAQLPATATWTTGGGLIGMQLPENAQVDNFAGGVVN